MTDRSEKTQKTIAEAMKLRTNFRGNFKSMVLDNYIRNIKEGKHNLKTQEETSWVTIDRNESLNHLFNSIFMTIGALNDAYILSKGEMGASLDDLRWAVNLCFEAVKEEWELFTHSEASGSADKTIAEVVLLERWNSKENSDFRNRLEGEEEWRPTFIHPADDAPRE